MGRKREEEAGPIQAVGIRELKAHLSAYVKRAEAGERIVVMERGREVAEAWITRFDAVHLEASLGILRSAGAS
jgi:hypothetical protein